LTDTNSWNYCLGVLNSADLPSRGLRARELIKSTLWWTGPEFIAKEEVILLDIDFITSAHAELAKMQPNLTDSFVAPAVPKVGYPRAGM